MSVVVTQKGADENFLNQLYSEIGGELAVELTHDQLHVAWDEQDALIKKLAKAIMKEYDKRFVLKIINKNYGYYEKAEKIEVWKKAMCTLANDEYEGNTEYLHRYRIVQMCLREYLDTSSQLVVDGFANFRLRDYYAELEEVVDLAAEDYLLEREYEEFVKMLKYFVALQPTKFQKVDLIWNGEQVKIMGDGADITSMCCNEFKYENSGIPGMSEEDLIISALISVAPAKIVLHNQEQVPSRELLKTLRSVFENKVAVCDGCALCCDKN